MSSRDKVIISIDIEVASREPWASATKLTQPYVGLSDVIAIESIPGITDVMRGRLYRALILEGVTGIKVAIPWIGKALMESRHADASRSRTQRDGWVRQADPDPKTGETLFVFTKKDDGNQAETDAVSAGIREGFGEDFTGDSANGKDTLPAHSMSARSDVPSDVPSDVGASKHNSNGTGTTNSRVNGAPSLEEVGRHVREKGYCIDPKDFHDYYSARDWKTNTGRSIIDTWQLKVRDWDNRERTKAARQDVGEWYEDNFYPRAPSDGRRADGRRLARFFVDECQANPDEVDRTVSKFLSDRKKKAEAGAFNEINYAYDWKADAREFAAAHMTG